jgi:hypothetical protein
MVNKVKMSPEFVEEDEMETETEKEEVTLPEPEIMEVDEEEDLDESMLVEDLDPNEPLWEGGPVAGQVVQWKEQYGEVFASTFTPEVHVIWRSINRYEYRNHIKKMEQIARSGQFTEAEAGLINEEALCEICVLFPRITPELLSAELAGLPTALSQDILEASGFVTLEVRKL